MIPILLLHANCLISKHNNLINPTIFTEVETNILIEVPDLGILTEANDEKQSKASFADAVAMARDAIGLACISSENNGRHINSPSKIQEIDITQGTFYEKGKSFVSLVDIDLLVYRRKSDHKMVRRNVTLPNWLNLEAKKAHINVSRVLQEALMSKLDVYK